MALRSRIAAAIGILAILAFLAGAVYRRAWQQRPPSAANVTIAPPPADGK